MTIIMRKDGRPAFVIKGKQYVSAGIIFYTINDGKLSFMLQKLQDSKHWGCRWQWEDFGGKSDKVDLSISEVAKRECMEETNFKLTADEIDAALTNKFSVKCHIPNNKYMLYLLYLSPDVASKLTSDVFGSVESHTGVKRTVHWISYTELIQYSREGKVHPRLEDRTKAIITYLSKNTFITTKLLTEMSCDASDAG